MLRRGNVLYFFFVASACSGSLGAGHGRWCQVQFACHPWLRGGEEGVVRLDMGAVDVPTSASTPLPFALRLGYPLPLHFRVHYAYIHSLKPQNRGRRKKGRLFNKKKTTLSGNQ